MAELSTMTRRDLRRAVGAEALGVIEQQREQIRQMAQVIAGMLADGEANREHWTTQVEVNRRMMDAQAAFQGRSLWQRLRWLVTGR